MVTLDSLIADRWVAGLKVNVDSKEFELLREAKSALRDRRIMLMQQLEWNSASLDSPGQGRCAVAKVLSEWGWRLDKELLSVPDLQSPSEIFSTRARVGP